MLRYHACFGPTVFMQDTQLTMFLTNWRFWEQTPLAQPLVQQKPVILLRDEKRINKRGAQGCWLLHAARTIEATGQVYQEVVCCVRLAMTIAVKVMLSFRYCFARSATAPSSCRTEIRAGAWRRPQMPSGVT